MTRALLRRVGYRSCPQPQSLRAVADSNAHLPVPALEMYPSQMYIRVNSVVFSPPVAWLTYFQHQRHWLCCLVPAIHKLFPRKEMTWYLSDTKQRDGTKNRNPHPSQRSQSKITFPSKFWDSAWNALVNFRSSMVTRYVNTRFHGRVLEIHHTPFSETDRHIDSPEM